MLAGRREAGSSPTSQIVLIEKHGYECFAYWSEPVVISKPSVKRDYSTFSPQRTRTRPLLLRRRALEQQVSAPRPSSPYFADSQAMSMLWHLRNWTHFASNTNANEIVNEHCRIFSNIPTFLIFSSLLDLEASLCALLISPGHTDTDLWISYLILRNRRSKIQ